MRPLTASSCTIDDLQATRSAGESADLLCYKLAKELITGGYAVLSASDENRQRYLKIEQATQAPSKAAKGDKS